MHDIVGRASWSYHCEDCDANDARKPVSISPERLEWSKVSIRRNKRIREAEPGDQSKPGD